MRCMFSFFPCSLSGITAEYLGPPNWPGIMESQVGYGLGEEEEGPNLGGIICARIQSSYVVSLRDLDIKFVKDFVFLHGKPSLPTHRWLWYCFHNSRILSFYQFGQCIAESMNLEANWCYRSILSSSCVKDLCGWKCCLTFLNSMR
jgi:hypothetical protein